MKFIKPIYKKSSIKLIALIFMLFIILMFIVRGCSSHIKEKNVSILNNSIEEELNHNSPTTIATEAATKPALFVEAISENSTSIDKIEIEMIQDKISNKDEVKTYEYTSTESGDYRFELSEIPDNVGFIMYLYNEDMEQLESKSCENGGGITYNLKPNTNYYVAITDWYGLGEYTLKYYNYKEEY